jgi:hypothetical protein
VDEFRAGRKELRDWPNWCFLPLAGTYAIVSKGKTVQSPNQAHHIGILGALATWRVTQGIYRFDPTTFDALWNTPVSGDIPTEVLFHLPEWCVYIPTPDQTWQGATLNGFFAHLESDIVGNNFVGYHSSNLEGTTRAIGMAHSRCPKRPQHKVKGVWDNENALRSGGAGWSPKVVPFLTATDSLAARVKVLR